MLRLFTSIKGVVSVKYFLCTFSDIEKDEQDIAFSYAFPYWDTDKGIIMAVPELLMEVIVTGIMTKTIARTTSNSCKANLESVGKHVHFFVKEGAGQFFEEVLHTHIHRTCYSMLHNMHTAYLMFNVCIYSMEVVYQKQLFLGVIEHFITNNEECKEMLVMCEECKEMLVMCEECKQNARNKFLSNWILAQ